MRLGEKESGRKVMRRFEMLRSIDTDIAKYREAIRHDPTDPALYRELARLYARRGQSDSALSTGYRTRCRVGRCPQQLLLLQQNRPEEAARAYRAALRADSTYAFAHNVFENLLAGNRTSHGQLDSSNQTFIDNLRSADAPTARGST